jgi:hypothetical protein
MPPVYAHAASQPAIDHSSSPPPEPEKLKKGQSLKDILLRLGPITNVSYKPFQPKPKQLARAILPPDFIRKPYPFDYFSLFFTPKLFQTITINTNQYTSLQRLYNTEERIQEWSDLLIEELYVFLGTIIYIGVYIKPQSNIYWNTDFNKGPIYTISSHISLCYF